MSGTIAFRPTYTCPWMYGRNFDLLFFFLPVILAGAVFCFTQTFALGTAALWMVVLLNTFGAGPFHQGPTWFFYFDKKHRQYFASTRNKRMIFYFGPPVIMLVSILLMVFVQPIGYFITMVWAVQHLIQQNVGILLLYHNQGKGEAVVPRPLLSGSLWAPCCFFFLMFLNRYLINPVFTGLANSKFLSGDSLQTCQIVTACLMGAVGLYATFVVGKYLFTLRKLVKEGMTLNLPATAFWALSILSFVPFGLVGRSFDEAFLIPVTIHWFQYIGLNYMLVKYKYVDTPGDNLNNLPPYAIFFATCIFLMALGLGLNAVKASGFVPAGSLPASIIFGIVVGLANVHYFLDAFIWRFRESYQRQEILPYLLRARQQAQ